MQQRTCTNEACDRPTRSKSSPFCNKCYDRERRANLPPCSVTDCDKPMSTRKSGMCGMHYIRLQKHGDTETVKTTAIAAPEGMKWCSNGHYAPLGDFHKSASSRTGLAPRCKEHARQQARQWGATNKARKATQGKKWRQENPEAHAAGGRRWYEANKESVKQRATEWMKDHPEVRRSINARRRARVMGRDDGTVTTEVMQAIREMDCVACGAPGPSEVDHIIPLAHVSGLGLHTADNLQPMCRWCNASKGAQTMDEWMATRRSA